MKYADKLQKWMSPNQGIQLKTQSILHSGLGYSPDGTISIQIGNRLFTAVFEEKVTVTPRNLDSILNRKERYNVNLIVAEYITPAAMENLRANEIGYLDSKGNLFYADENVFVWIDHLSNTMQKETSRTPKAFSKKGLYLVYNFLKDEDLMNDTYINIESKTGVSRNTVGRVLGSLNEEGYLDSSGGRMFFIEDEKESLRQDWIRYYDKQVLNNISVKDDKGLIINLEIARNDLA